MLFADDYLVLVPSYAETKEHSHSMLHLILSEEEIQLQADILYKGEMILLSPFVSHQVRVKPGRTLLFLIDPSSRLGEEIEKKFLQEKIYCNSLPEKLAPYLKKALEGYLQTIFPDFWTSLGILSKEEKKDERVDSILDGVKDHSLLFFSLPELADFVYLSESRLTHLFKETTGMSLKNYLLMRRMELAFRLVHEGMTITEAAHMAGFFDSAHLANVVRKTTGISLSEVFK